MDTLVAQYSRPAYQYEGYSQEEQQELLESTPPLSLKFALPSMPDVSFLDCPLSYRMIMLPCDKFLTMKIARCVPPRNNR